MEVLKRKITTSFVKRGMTIEDVRKMSEDRVDINLVALAEEEDLAADVLNSHSDHDCCDGTKKKENETTQASKNATGAPA